MPTLILTESSSVALKAVLSVKDMKRILSRASDAFEISSRRKIYKTKLLLSKQVMTI